MVCLFLMEFWQCQEDDVFCFFQWACDTEGLMFFRRKVPDADGIVQQLCALFFDVEKLLHSRHNIRIYTMYVQTSL